MRSLLSRAPSPEWAERSLRFDEGRKAPEIRLSKLRIEKRGQVPAVHGATLRVPFRDFPAVGFVWSRTSSSLLNLSGIWRPAGAGFAVILTAKSKAVGTTASRHSQDGCVPIHDSEVALPTFHPNKFKILRKFSFFRLSPWSEVCLYLSAYIPTQGVFRHV